MAWTTSSGAGIRYEVSGRGHRNLVLLHELGGCLESWDEVTRLLDSSFRILRYDQRGAGQSEKVRAAFGFDDQLRDLEAVIEAAHLDPPYDLVGVAAGAGIGLGFAARYPDRVSTAIFFSPATSVNEERRQYLHNRAETASRDGMRAVIDATLGRSYPESRIRDRNTYEAYWTRFLANDPVSYALSNRAMADAEPERNIASVTCPCLLVAGSHDDLRPEDYVRSIASRLRHAELDVLDGGHFPHVQEPLAVAERIRDFLSVQPCDVFVNVRGIRFHCRVDGPAGAPWIVFSNSLATNISLWDDQVEALKGRFRILRYDQRGHGTTRVLGDAPLSACTFDELANDAAALVEWFQIEQATFIGVSMGAVTGLLLAARHPERLARVVAADGQWCAPITARNAWEERINVATTGGMEALADPTIDRWFTAETVAAKLPALDKVRRMIGETPLDGFIACARALQGFDFQEEFPRITIPVLLVVGARDGALPEVMATMHRAIPGSGFDKIEGAGHLPNVEKPEAFNRLIADFAKPAPRLKPLSPAEMDNEQRRVHDAAASGRRGHAPAPLLAWLRSPQLADRAQSFGELVRYGTSLPPRLSELAILVVARAWTSQYEWFAHKPEALKAGLDATVIDSIAQHRVPSFKNEDERLVHAFALTVSERRDIPETLYRETVDALGERAVVELIMLLGYYTFVAMTINTFGIELPGGAAPELV